MCAHEAKHPNTNLIFFSAIACIMSTLFLCFENRMIVLDTSHKVMIGWAVFDLEGVNSNNQQSAMAEKNVRETKNLNFSSEKLRNSFLWFSNIIIR
jgi:hypothetical protein